MFDLPARFHQDEKYYSARIKTRAYFRKAEEQELKGVENAEKRELAFSERKDNQVSASLNPRYIGLVSHGIYNKSGDLVGDTVTTALATHGRNQKPRKYDLRHARWGTKSHRVSIQGFSSAQQHTVVLKSGLELLPRSTAPPRVRHICETTRNMIQSKSFGRHHLSDKAQKVLARTNFSHDRSLSYDLRGDTWAMGRHMLRRRGMQVTASILWLSLVRGDYERAHKALAVLLRSDGIIMRNLWMPAVEILAWEQSHGGVSNKARTPSAFLDWLIVNFPSLPNSAALWRKIPRAEKFRPQAIMNKLASGDYYGAMQKAEDAILTIPSSVDPLCWALAGLAALKAEDATGQNRTLDARKYFRRCLELGGVLPPRFLEGIDNYSVSKQDSDPDTNPRLSSEHDSDSSVDVDGGLTVNGREDDDSESDEMQPSPESGNSGLEDVKPHVLPGGAPKSVNDIGSAPEGIVDAEDTHESPPRVKIEASQALDSTSSQARSLGAAWGDSESEESESDDEQRSDLAEVKAEIRNTVPQSQRSLGMTWSDSESEDDN